jgi:protein phosphatase
MDASTSIWSECLDYAASSNVGLRRPNNQDAYVVSLAGSQADFEERGHFFIVADGMGAHAAGELASKMATEVVSLVYRKRLDQSPPEAILSAMLDANYQINSRGQASPDFRGMGTTATALVLLPTGALVAHVGDSRAYRLRGTRIEQLTFDHSLVWEIRAAGQMPDLLPNYIPKNIITRSLGPNRAVQIDLEGPHPLQVGDTFLLCSDGLSGQVTDDEIGMVLSCLPAAEAAQALVDLANLRGGPDNITVIVVRVTGPQLVQEAAVEAPGNRQPSLIAAVHPMIWTVMGVAALATVGLLAMGYLLAALLGLVVTAAAGIAAMTQRRSAAQRGGPIEPRRFGRGPYMACDGTPSAPLLARLTEIVEQLRAATAGENWPIDWAGFDNCLARATAAAQAENLTEAAREYLRAIMVMMSQLRQIRGVKEV